MMHINLPKKRTDSNEMMKCGLNGHGRGGGKDYTSGMYIVLYLHGGNMGFVPVTVLHTFGIKPHVCACVHKVQ